MTDTLNHVATSASARGVFNHYRALAQTHRSLEEKLAAEVRRPAPDNQLIRRIKKRKLLIKDEIAGIERLLEAIDARTETETAEIIPLRHRGGRSAGLPGEADPVPAA